LEPSSNNGTPHLDFGFFCEKIHFNNNLTSFQKFLEMQTLESSNEIYVEICVCQQTIPSTSIDGKAFFLIAECSFQLGNK
jgi:hypothetical protein